MSENKNATSEQMGSESLSKGAGGGRSDASAIRPKLIPAIFSLALVLLVLSPVVRNWSEVFVDGFPLSHFPMFTVQRGETTNVTHLIGVRPNGSKIIIPYTFAAVGGMNQARRQISRDARDPERAEMLCERAARRIARRGDPQYADIERVRLVTSTYNIDGFFNGDTEPVKERRRAGCRVPGRSRD